MKMHGLGDGPYWLISYAYFLAISSLYMIVFVVFGSLIGNIYTQELIFLSNFCCFFIVKSNKFVYFPRAEILHVK